jgi:hypothetical protein
VSRRRLHQQEQIAPHAVIPDGAEALDDLEYNRVLRLGAVGGRRSFKEIARIDVQLLRQGEKMAWRQRALATLEASDLLVAKAESAAEFRLGDRKRDAPLADARADIRVHRVENAPGPELHN